MNVAVQSTVLNVRIRQAVRDIAPRSVYSESADAASQTKGLRDIAFALKADLEGGYGTSLHELAHAEVFDDQLDEAQELFTSGYVVAAAVTAGSAGEAHLRRLAVKSGVAVLDTQGKPIKASVLNAELQKANVYTPTVAKNVTAWQGTRNDAAHGDAAKVTPSLAQGLIDGLRRFMADYPA